MYNVQDCAKIHYNQYTYTRTVADILILYEDACLTMLGGCKSFNFRNYFDCGWIGWKDYCDVLRRSYLNSYEINVWKSFNLFFAASIATFFVYQEKLEKSQEMCVEAPQLSRDAGHQGIYQEFVTWNSEGTSRPRFN